MSRGNPLEPLTGLASVGLTMSLFVSAATSAGVHRLGHYLLWVLPTAAMVESIARTTLVHAAVTFDAGFMAFFGEWEAPWWAVITGIALLSPAQIVRTGAEMRADLEGIV